MAVSPVATWPPTIDELLRDIDVAEDDTRDVDELAAVLAAAIVFVQRARPEITFSRNLAGETVKLELFVSDDQGHPETPTSIALVVRLPDGTDSPETVGAAVETGHYVHPFLTALPGLYRATWTLVGPGAAGTRMSVEEFVMIDPNARVTCTCNGNGNLWAWWRGGWANSPSPNTRGRCRMHSRTLAPDADLKLGTIRLAARWYSRRLTPSALIELGQLGGARVPSFDPDIERLLRIGRHRQSVTA